MSRLAAALIADLDADTLAALAARLAPHLPQQTPAAPDGWLAPAAAAEYLGVKRRRVYDLKSAGALEPDGYDGRTPLWRRSTLDAYALDTER